MCIEPPRPRLVPWSRPISSANMPSGSRPLARQWPWPRWVDVITSAGPSGQHAPTAEASWPIDRCTKPGTSPSRYERGDPLLEAADHQHPPVHLEQVGVRGHGPRSVLIGTRSGRGDDRADRDPRPRCPHGGDVQGKRVVITGAGRGLGRLLAHAFSQAGALRGAGRPHRDGPQGGGRGAPGPRPRVQRRRHRRGLQRRGRRRHRGRVGRRRRVDLQRRDLARSWPVRSRPIRRCGARCSTSTSPAPSSAPGPPPG